MKVKINNIQDIPCELYLNDEKIGIIYTMLQLEDVKIQILKNSLEGYYILFNHNEVTERIDIDKKGHCSNYPRGFFDTLETQLNELCGWRRKYKEIIEDVLYNEQ